MKTQTKLAMALLATCFAFSSVSADTPKSMRGSDVAAADTAPADKAYAGARPGTQQPVARTFSTQPPVIPHAVDNFDEVTLDANQCLDCHGAANYKKKNSPMVGESHFLTHDGKKTGDSTAIRHNCVQCHVPQVDAPPLVENAFKGDDKQAAAGGKQKASK